MVYATHRQVGISEATYRLLPGMHMKDSNIKCIFVLTGFPKNRSIFWQKVQGDNNEELNLEEDEDSDTEDKAPTGKKRPVKLPGRKGLFQESTTVHDRYAARPTSSDPNVEGKLEKLCLAQFVTSYTPINKLPKKIEMEKDGCSKSLSSQKIFNSDIFLPMYITLLDGLGFMRLRGYPQVMRIHNSKKKESFPYSLG